MPTQRGIASQPVRLSCLHYVDHTLLRIDQSEQFVIVGVEYYLGENGQPRVTDILIVIASEQLKSRDEDEILTLLPKQMEHAILNMVRDNERKYGNTVSTVTLPNGERLI